jgi:uncharacterized membrane protein (DUF373 family)
MTERLPHPNWSRRIVVSLVVLAGVTLIALLGAAFLPRWWAQRVADQTQGSFTSGTLVGLFYGFVFTLVPLALLWVALEIFRSWKIRIGALVVAAVLAVPNLLTLGIVLGGGSGAHAGDRILDVEAPFFRGATLIGVLVAIACLGATWYLVAWRGRPTRPEGTAPP